MTSRNDDTDEVFGEADPADVAEQQLNIDPDTASDLIDEEEVEISVEAEPADVLEQRQPVGGDEDYPRG